MITIENNEPLRARELKFGETFRLLKTSTRKDGEEILNELQFPPLCMVLRPTSTVESRGGTVDVQGSALTFKPKLANIPLHADSVVERVNVKITIER